VCFKIRPAPGPVVLEANESPALARLPGSTKKQTMSPLTVTGSTGIIGDTGLSEVTWRPSAGFGPQALAIETEQLSRAIAGRVLVSNISVQVQPGEVLAVVGPSGAGKSSFLRLLNRLDEPTGGTVRLKGQDYRELAPQELRRRIGMVMQMAYLFPGTIAANIAFGPRQRGERLAAEQIDALLERVGLPGYRQRDVSNLSGGEAQRVSVARTLANAPEALLLDEPTSALDDVSARGIEELVLSIIRERRMTCVIVTHNTAQAHRIADRTMILQAGKLVAIGPTKEVLRDR
jgi:putative ABC transport system ATP-binding protein